MSLPRRRKRAKMGVRQESRVRSAAHLQWVRGHECAIAGKSFTGTMHGLAGTSIEFRSHHACEGKIQAHHVRVTGDGTTGKKPGDDKTVPLCRTAHDTGHSIGWKSFEARYRVDLTALAAELWKRSPHRVKYEQRQRQLEENMYRG